MQRFLPSFQPTVLFSTATLAVPSIALLTVGMASFGGERTPAAVLSPPAQVAATLDQLVQPRFQVDAGMFGNARIGVPGHDAVLDKEVTTDFEKHLEARTKKANRAYTVGFFHCAKIPGKFKPSEDPDSKQAYAPTPPYYAMFYLAGKKVFSNGGDGVAEPEAAAWDKQYQADVQSLCVKAMPKLKQGEGVDVTTGKWLVAMRPIRALKTSCLSCHAGAHQGDTLGVMVYTISKTTLAP